MHNEFYPAIKKNKYMSFSGKINGIIDDHIEWNKSNSERQISHLFFPMLCTNTF